MKYKTVIKHYLIKNKDGTEPFGKEVDQVWISYEDGKPKYAHVGRDTIRNESKLKKIADFFGKFKKDRKIAWQTILEQYVITDNDGTGPFRKEVTNVVISYEDGKPNRAILGADCSLDELINLTNPTPIIKDKSTLAKIVEFFNQK